MECLTKPVYKTGLLLTGIGRNEYIDIMNKYKSKVYYDIIMTSHDQMIYFEAFLASKISQ